MAENLKPFENLKETTANSLDDREKAELNKISSKDFQSQKDKIGEKLFTVNGKSMKLKDVVKNLKFDASGSMATLNGKSIAWKSELGAAIQIYAIAHNKSVGRMLIDGKIGTESIRGLQGTQTDVKAERNNQKQQPNKSPESDETTSRLSFLLRSDYRNRVGKYNNSKYNLLDTSTGDREGALKDAIRVGNTETIQIRYKSAIGRNGTQLIKIDASKCKEGGNYSANKFGKAIENAITKKETELKKAEDARIAKEKLNAKQESIVDAVESFDVRQLSKKAQAYLRKKNFVLNNKLDLKDGLFSGTGIAFDAKGNLHFGNVFYIPKSQVDSFYVNNSFNATKFKSLLSPLLDKKANEYFTASAHDVVSKINKRSITTSTLPTAEAELKKANSDIKDIKSIGVSIPAADQKILDSKNRELQIVKDFKEVSTGIEGVLDGLEKESRKTMSPVAMKDFRERVARRYQWAVSKKRTYHNKVVYDVYKQMANGENKYQKLVARIKKINDSVN